MRVENTLEIATRDPDVIAGHAHAIRIDVLRMIAPIGQGYVQQGLGAAEIFATLYFAELRLNPRGCRCRSNPSNRACSGAGSGSLAAVDSP
jgi:transketolase N-terminal domain/subunit